MQDSGAEVVVKIVAKIFKIGAVSDRVKCCLIKEETIDGAYYNWSSPELKNSLYRSNSSIHSCLR